MLQISVISCLLFGLVSSSGDGWVYDYKNNGADWGTIQGPNGTINYCGRAENQSPINLMDPIGKYGRAYGKYLT